MAIGMTNIVGELGIKITGYTKELSNSLKDATREIKGFGKNTELISKAGKIALTGMATAATGLAAGLAMSAKSAVTFEKGMSNIATLVNTGKESMEEMGKAVLDIGKRTPVAIDELVSALYQVRSGGVDASEAMNVLEDAAKLGVAGLGTTEESVKLMTAAFNNFKDTGISTGEIANILFKTVKDGTTDISQLSQQFGALAAMSKTAGVSFEEMQAATAALTTVTGQTAESQTKLRTLFDEMTRTSGKLADGFKKAGVQNVKMSVQNKGLKKTLEDLMKSVNNDAVAFKNLFSSAEAGTAAMLLLTGASESYDSTLDTMTDKVDLLSEAFKKQKETVSAQWQSMKNNLNALSIQIGSALLPALNDALEGIIGFIDSIPELIEQFRNWVAENDVVQGVLVALGSILTGLAISVIPSLVVSLGTLIATVIAAAAPFVAIGAIITGVYVAFKNWDKITAFVKEVWGKVKDYTKQAWDFLQPYLETSIRAVVAILTLGLSEVVIFFVENWDKIKQTTLDLWEWMKPYLQTVIRAILAILTAGVSEVVIYVIKNWEEIKQKTVAIWETVKNQTVEIWNKITDFFASVWKKIQNIFSSNLRAVDKAWTATWEGIKDLAANAWDFIKEKVTDGIVAIKDIFEGGVNIIGNAWRSIWDNLTNILSGIFETIKSKVNGVISWVQRAIDKINVFKREKESVGAGGSWATGGYTFGNINEIAGVVHGGEWVAPAWLVDKYRSVIGQLETIRSKGYKQGGFAGSSSTSNYNNQRTVHQTITQNIREGVDFSIAARELAWQARFN